MKFFIAIITICLLALVAGQEQRYFFGQIPSARVPRQFSFQAPTVVRDPRQNRGPVVFPPSPPDAIDESSGVVVGASGYGFVPPSQTTIFG